MGALATDASDPADFTFFRGTVEWVLSQFVVADLVQIHDFYVFIFLSFSYLGVCFSDLFLIFFLSALIVGSVPLA